MIREIGSRNFPLWLLGDSNPKNWGDALESPLDPRHPARHSIWTPIVDVIQDKVYRNSRLRMDTSEFFIRNAIGDPKNKPAGNQVAWPEPVREEILYFRSLAKQYLPKAIFCFGAFSYEFARRVMIETHEYPHGHRGARRLGEDFRRRVAQFNPNRTAIFPLLHVTIARGKFIQSHQYFTDQPNGNYFDHVGSILADLFITYNDELRIWI